VKVIAAVLTISFVTFVIFFGRLPALRKTPIGALYRVLMVHLPRALYDLDSKVTGGYLYASSSNLITYMMTKRHPTVLILFIALLAVSEWLFLPDVFPPMTRSMKIAVVTIVFAPYTFIFLSAFTDPGFIDHENHDLHGTLYPYDHIIFHPGKLCTTCNLAKPARSKHCSLCGHCIARADHHCIFINACVGYGNLHWFLLLLGSTSILTLAGAYLGGDFLLAMIKSRYPNFTALNTGLSWSEYLSFWQWALSEKPGVTGVALLCVCTSPLVLGLFLFNIYQIWAGITTNESGKWQDIKFEMKNGNVYSRPLSRDRHRDAKMEPVDLRWPREAKHIVVYQENGTPSESGLPGYGHWTQLWTMDSLDNVYDIGFWRNLGDIIYPRRILELFF